MDVLGHGLSLRALAVRRFDLTNAMQTVLNLSLALAVFLACVLPATAQPYPTKPIRFLVPFPPGGGNDTMARTFGQKMSERFGQPVVIDNRAGAGGNIGAETA